MSDPQSPTFGAAQWPVRVPDPVRPVPPATHRPTMSVVVAAYQAAASVAEALDSALAQTDPADEIIVCDDGSTDATAQVLAGYADRVRVLHRANGGEAAAKNTAVAAATGEYVVVLDADDVFEPERLRALRWLATLRPDLDVLTTDAVVEAGGCEMRHAYHPGWTFPVVDQRTEILRRNFVLGLAAVRRERWMAMGGFDESLDRATDWDFWMRLVLSGSGVGLVDAPLARYRLATGTLSSDRPRQVEARITVLVRAAARRDLSADERATVARSLREQRLDLAVRRAAGTLPSGGWPARREHARLLTRRGLPRRARAAAAVAVLAPGLLARRRHRRADGTVEIGSGLRVRPPER